MSIQLPPELDPFVQQRVATGAYASQGDVIRAAFSLLEEREHLIKGIEAGFAQIRSGKYTEYGPESLPPLPGKHSVVTGPEPGPS